MFCKKCGAELPEGTRFCSKCGVNLSGGNVQKPEKKTSFNVKELFTGTKKKYAIATSAILGVLVIAVLLFVILVLPNMAVNGFKAQIQNREYRDAYLAYEEFDSEDRTKANKWMREYIGTVENDYYAGKLDYSTATGILEELMQFDAAYNEATKAGENVYLDNQSAIAFDIDALTLMTHDPSVPYMEYVKAISTNPIASISNIHKYVRPEDVPEHTMFIITTDGMENASRKYSSDEVKKMIECQKEEFGWEFLFIGANIDAVETAACFGINRNHAVNYHADSKGTQVL